MTPIPAQGQSQSSGPLWLRLGLKNWVGVKNSVKFKAKGLTWLRLGQKYRVGVRLRALPLSG